MTLIRPVARAITLGAGKSIPVLPGAGQLRINWSHPLTCGLVGAYLPGISWNDYTGNNGPFTYIDAGNSNAACTGTVAAATEGPAVGNSVSTGASAGLCTLNGTICPAIATWSTSLSFYLRINQIASTTNSSGGNLFVDDTTHAAIGLATAAGTTASNAPALFFGSFSSTANGSGWANGIHGILGSINVAAGTSNVWLDGVTTYLSVATVTASTCTLATTHITLNGDLDNTTLALYFWNRALTQAEAISLEAGPYGFFTPQTTNRLPVGLSTIVNPFVNVWLSR